MEPFLPFCRPARSYKRGQVGVHVAGISAAARNFFPGGGNFTQGVGVVGDIGQNDQHVHILFKGQILRGSQRHTGSSDTLDSRVVCQVDKQNGTVDGAGFLESSR